MYDDILKMFGVVLCLHGVIAYDCEMEYEAAFRENIHSCANFNNKVINAENLKLSTSDSGEGEGSMSMKGSLTLKKEIEEGAAIQIVIYKETELGNKEFINGARWDICSNLQNPDTPWHPLLVCLGISECPIPAKEYPIDELLISLDSVQHVMTHEFCGDYEVHMCIVNELDKLSCHIVNLAIVEKPGENCKR